MRACSSGRRAWGCGVGGGFEVGEQGGHGAGEVGFEDGGVDVAFAADGGGVAEALETALTASTMFFLSWVSVSQGSKSRRVMAARTVPAQVRKSLAVKCFGR